MSATDMVTPSHSTLMPTLTKAQTIPVSWQIGRRPSAHSREFVRIWAIASFAAGDCSASYASASAVMRSEERRVGKECRARREQDEEKKKEIELRVCLQHADGRHRRET